MNHPQGRVIELSGDEPNRQALVEVSTAEFCQRCADGKGCGAGLLGRSSQSRQILVDVPARMHIAVGDQVAISLAPKNVLSAAGIVYGWPLLGATLGVTLAYAASLGDPAAAGSALMGLAAGAIGARYRLRGDGCLRRFMPRIVA